MLKKIFPLLFMIMFLGIFSYFNGESFFEHKEKNENIVEQKMVTQGKLEDFSLEKIRELENTDFYYTPYKELLNKIVDKIDGAKQKVYVEVYMLTETRIKAALVKAKNRGVDVKVVLEHSPYLAVMLNQKHFKELESKGVDIVWSNPKHYALNHSKIMLIDDELILSTGNFTYSTFAHNRDLFLFSRDESTVAIFNKIFLKDYAGEEFQIYDDNIILSPYSSRSKFVTMIEGAEYEIKMYAQYLKDEKLFNILKQEAENGIKIEIILSKNGYESYSEENRICGDKASTDSTCQKFVHENIVVSAINDSAKMHSKAILVDEKYLFIGSINFSTSSMDKNREMGLLLSNTEIITKFLKVFEGDK
ncbi:phosphatidylserine/phosphatidylglycerophosphate/cardiolipin synthase family protein [Candidatus Gracilibacteria bacterium]|nr:phosphatidylserine/phosphatidylglycerophosphate/cardiolipin synthase family protein [Candidatus Gracilibacteria bacterium]